MKFYISNDHMLTNAVKENDSEDISKVYIPDGVKRIAKFAFQGYEEIKEVVLPETVKEIGSVAFDDCINLEKINLENVDIKIEKGAFANTKIEEIKLSPMLKKIYNFAFTDMQYLKKIEIPPSVKTIGKFAFSGCEELAEIVLHEGLQKICEDAFEGCTELLDITIPSTVKEIHGLAFANCYDLEIIDILSDDISFYKITNDFRGMENTKVLLSKKAYESNKEEIERYISNYQEKNLDYILSSDNKKTFADINKMIINEEIR